MTNLEIINDEKSRAFAYTHCGESTLNISKILIRNLGLQTAAFLEMIVSKEKYFYEKNLLTNDGYFWNTEQDRKMDCGLSPYQQNQSIKILEKLGILFPVERRGVPAKQYFKISYKKFEEQFLNFLELDIKNLRTLNKNKGNKNNNKNNFELSKDNSNGDFSKSPNDDILFLQKTSRRKNKKFSKSQIENKPHLSGGKLVILKTWNSIPDVNKHKNLSTKLIYNANKYITYLEKGIFFDHFQIDKEFIKKNKIPSYWFGQPIKFTRREITNAIKTYSLFFKDNYWPVNKKHLPRSIDKFIYNYNYKTKKGTSYLLKILANPEIKSFDEERKLIDHNPNYTKHFEKLRLLRFFREEDLPSVYRGINAIETMVVKNKVFCFDNGSTNPELKRKIGSGPGNLEPMFERYAFYLSEFNRIEDPENIFSPYSKYFKGFLQHLKTSFRSFDINF